MARGTLVMTFVAAFFATVALRQFDLGHLPWALSRASGLASFVVLSLSVILGLLISTKASDGLLSRPFVFEMHQFMSVLSLSLIAVHVGSLLFDGYLALSVKDLLVPFVAPDDTVAIGIGVIAAWLTAITTASFWVRSRIGVKRWRTLHYLTFAAYGTALWHGFAAGTDSQAPVVYWGYVLSAGAVLALTTLRIADRKVKRAAPRRQPATAAARRAA